MANKKLLGTATSELRLPAKKVKGDKKPKWQAKTGNGKPRGVDATEPMETVAETPATELDQPQEALPPADTPNTNEASEPAPTLEPTETQPTEEPAPATDPDPTSKKAKKLKVKADLKPKKLSMIKAALQVLQDRKVPMTCPEMIDVMATERLWVSSGGKTPAASLYAALSRSIKDEGKASAFRKTERGKFEAKVLVKE